MGIKTRTAADTGVKTTLRLPCVILLFQAMLFAFPSSASSDIPPAGSARAEWQEMHIRLNESVWASSSLTETIRGQKVTYGPEALFDGDSSTPWVEGADGGGIGESVHILTQRPVHSFTIINGFARTASLFEILEFL